jgi:hypothetical protein
MGKPSFFAATSVGMSFSLRAPGPTSQKNLKANRDNPPPAGKGIYTCPMHPEVQQDHSIVTHHLNMFTLVAIGVGTAYGFSAVVMLVPGAFPKSFAPDG